jgi:hypothetical protein
MRVNTDEKIHTLKNYIQLFGADTLNKIITKKKTDTTLFYKKSELIKFLDKYSSYFSQEELNILEYHSKNIDFESISMFDETGKPTDEKTTEKLQENTEVETIPKLQQNTSVVLMEMLKNEELANKFIFLLNNIDEILQVKQIVKENMIIPNEILNLEAFPTSVRVSKKLLDQFNEFCNKNKNYSKIQILNFVLYDFLQKYDK